MGRLECTVVLDFYMTETAALADYMKTQVHATMRAEQLASLSGVVSAAHGMAPLDAAGMARELRDWLPPALPHIP